MLVPVSMLDHNCFIGLSFIITINYHTNSTCFFLNQHHHHHIIHADYFVSTQYVHLVCPPSISTQYIHPVYPPSISTQYIHPVCPPSVSTQCVHPVCPPSVSTQCVQWYQRWINSCNAHIWSFHVVHQHINLVITYATTTTIITTIVFGINLPIVYGDNSTQLAW